MGVSRLSTEESDPQRPFKRTATRNDFPKNRADGPSGEWSAIRCADPLKDFLLAMGDVNLLTS